MFHQIEVTTKCNFRCFYCAGRSMPQRNMSEATMNDILGKLTPGRHVVSLQGEGEPTMHPRFWDWASRLTNAGYIPYTITNGSRIDVDLAHQHLPNLGVSLDTVDGAEANRIGRLKLDNVLLNLELLRTRLGPKRLIIHTVDYGQPLGALVDYLRERNLTRHIIQPLQPKADYALHYQDHPISRPSHRHAGGLCRYLAKPLMRYFDVNGKELPCCFIKNTSPFQSVKLMRQQMAAGQVPTVCEGCTEIPTARPTLSV